MKRIKLILSVLLAISSFLLASDYCTSYALNDSNNNSGLIYRYGINPVFENYPESITISPYGYVSFKVFIEGEIYNNSGSYTHNLTVYANVQDYGSYYSDSTPSVSITSCTITNIGNGSFKVDVTVKASLTRLQTITYSASDSYSYTVW